MWLYNFIYIQKKIFFLYIFLYYQKENIQEQKEVMNISGKQPKIFRFVFCFKTLIKFEIMIYY